MSESELKLIWRSKVFVRIRCCFVSRLASLGMFEIKIVVGNAI